jgi:small subunit ribosomal protein S17
MAPVANAARSHRKERVGEVISNKMAKTIVVRVERRFRIPASRRWSPLQASSTRTTRSSEAKVGDRVRIEETRPLVQD